MKKYSTLSKSNFRKKLIPPVNLNMKNVSKSVPVLVPFFALNQ